MGYNWQAENFVFGLEGTISGLDNHGTVLNNVFGAGRDDQFGWRADWIATITGRAGVAVRNNLFYVKGGYAGVNNRLSVTDVLPPVTGSGSQTQWHNGWTVGAGWEYGITQNWIVGLEYDYAAFDSKRYQLAGLAAPAAVQLRYEAARHSVGGCSSELQVQRLARRAILNEAKFNERKSPGVIRGFFLEHLTTGPRVTP